MKKNIITSFIALSLISSGAAYANSPEQHEQELNEILKILEGRSIEKESLKSEEISKKKEPIRRIRIHQPSAEQPTEKESSKKSQFMTKTGGIDNYDHLYLLNIPIGTQIYFKEDFYIPPYRDGLIYKNGSIQSKSPLFDNVKNTFCYFNINESGFVRRFKADENNSLAVDSNYSTADQFVDEDNNTITLYQTTLYFEHDHVDSLRCLTTEKNKPLNIGELNVETGSIMKFTFPEIIDI